MMTHDAYNWSPDQPKQHDNPWTRVYRKGGRQAHIAELTYSAHPNAPGSWDDSGTWYGTGSQDEYDHAARLPLCIHCFIIMTQYECEEI